MIIFEERRLRIFSCLLITILLVGAIASFKVHSVRGMDAIYIRADGSIDPSTAPIQRNGDLYTLTDNITSDGDGIVVERGNVVIDGNDYTLQGSGSGSGIGLLGMENVTVQNALISAFDYGICLNGSSNYNSICRNSITANNYYGIYLGHSSNNTISGNRMTANGFHGIRLDSSSNNTIGENNITNQGDGIFLAYSSYNGINGNNITTNGAYGTFGICLAWSSYNIISGNVIGANNEFGIVSYSFSNYNRIIRNNVANNDGGIWLDSTTSLNMVYHNNFIANNIQARDDSLDNLWDNGYPSGGNYWSDYSGVDLYSGPYQNDTGSDRMGDSPYVIDANNRDNYPWMTPIIPILGDVNKNDIVDIFDCVTVALVFGSIPSDANWTSAADINNDGIVDIFDIVVVALHFGETS